MNFKGYSSLIVSLPPTHFLVGLPAAQVPYLQSSLFDNASPLVYSFMNLPLLNLEMSIMVAASWLRALRSALKSSGRGRKYASSRCSPRLELLEDRRVPTVTAVNDAFTVGPNTYNQLNVVANDTNSTGVGVQVASVGSVFPSGPSLTRLSNGDLAFSSAHTGTYTFNYTATDQAQTVTAGDGAASDDFGYSVAVSGDTVAIGACYHTWGSGSNDIGAVYVFTFSGSAWVLRQELTNEGNFGWSVALDGNTLVVGAKNAG